VTLTSLAAQSLPEFRIVVSDQTEEYDAAAEPLVQTPVRLLRARGRPVELLRHLPRRGMAEQRAFLLAQARAPYALFLDDDVVLDADVLVRLLAVIEEQRCGFVGMPLVGLSFVEDRRPHQQIVEPWNGRVAPERVEPGGAAWARHHLHSAANAWHVQERLGLAGTDALVYKVAWVGGCVLYDVAKLRAVGGFDFWRELPPQHCGEDVLAQLRVMAAYGGCGLLPTGAFHQELPTTVADRTCDAPFVLGVDVGIWSDEPAARTATTS
jgi:GT2 family glycosyltransferase